MTDRLICGTAFHAPHQGAVEVLDEVLISVDATGAISEVVHRDAPNFEGIRTNARNAGRLTQLADGQYLLPGLVDLHIHAPQWPQLGKALDAPLEIWLQKYTFPLEARYEDVAFAHMVYDELVDGLLGNGTTTAVYFATIHMEASLALAETCLRKGQRAFVGKVAMDDPDLCPAIYRDRDAVTATAEMRTFIECVRALTNSGHALVQPIITPRFIPSCTDSLLDGLGRVAAETGTFVQTHCSESDWEREFVRARFGKTDVEVLRDFGLLRQGTILAHSNFVTDSDLALISDAGAAVAHCPLSNIYFAKAVFPLRAALSRNVHAGLGSDVSGGHCPSILEACRHALLAARVLEGGVDPTLPASKRGVADSAIAVADAFWLATAGGGEALGLPVGKFAPGYKFDALLIDLNVRRSDVHAWPGLDSLDDVFQKIVLNATRSNIVRTWVNGESVFAASA